MHRRKMLKMLSAIPVAGMFPQGLAAMDSEVSENPVTGLTDLSGRSLSSSAQKSPIINASEHVWLMNDSRFPINPEISTCPGSKPPRDYSGEHLIEEMNTYGIDKTVISHVCYYGRNNDYTIHCVKTWPDRFAGFGLLFGNRLFAPNDPKNPERLEKLVKEDGLTGLRLSPIQDPQRVWMNDPGSYPWWKKAEEIGATFNIFLAPQQISQVADMAERYPGVKIVIDHLAMMDITKPDSEGIIPLCNLVKFPNVYIRTSMHNPSKQKPPYRDVWPYLKRIYDTFGPQRMLFANFFEYLIMKDIIPFFTEEDKVWILGKTAEGIYFNRS